MTELEHKREIELNIRIRNARDHSWQGELWRMNKDCPVHFGSKQELMELIGSITDDQGFDEIGQNEDTMAWGADGTGSIDTIDTRRPHKLTVRCFGSFEVFWQGEPLLFRRKRTKELFAFLIDRECASCTAEEIAAALWEDSEDIQRLKSMIRNSIHDLKVTLRSIGMEDALIRKRELIALRRDMIDCDYYRLLDGDLAAAEQFTGRYMIQYSWAENTLGRIWFSEKHKLSVKYP